MPLDAALYTDPACPWAYSANPAFSVLRWRYGDGLRWRLVAIGLSEDPDRYVRAGYTPAAAARGYLRFRRYGMPFATEPRRRISSSGRACRALVATRLRDPRREWAALRALQFGWFTTSLVLDEDADLRLALEQVPGLDAEGVVAALDDADVAAAYESDRAETRTAAGGPTEFQGKAANTDGAVRYTAPSVVLTAPPGDMLEAGGFQPVEAYDLAIANLDRTLTRRPPPDDPLEALRAFPHGLTTQEVAAIMAPGNEPPDRTTAEERLIDRAAESAVEREPLGDDALWIARAGA